MDPINLGPITDGITVPDGFLPPRPAAPALEAPPRRPLLPSLPSGPNPQMAKLAPDTPQARFAKAMSLIIPALVAGSAARQGALGSLVNGYLSTQQMQRRNEAEDASMQFERDQYGQRVREHQDLLARQEEERQTRLAAEAERAATAKETGIRAAITTALQPFRENPLYAEGITPEFASSASINVPGVGPISLLDAFDHVGVAKVGGKYILSSKGKEAPKTTTRQASLSDGIYNITSDESGKVVGRTFVGKQYQRPRAERPEKTPEAKTRVYNVKDDDANSDTYGKTFRVTEDASTGEILAMEELDPAKLREKVQKRGAAPAPAPKPGTQIIGGFEVTEVH